LLEPGRTAAGFVGSRLLLLVVVVLLLAVGPSRAELTQLVIDLRALLPDSARAAELNRTFHALVRFEELTRRNAEQRISDFADTIKLADNAARSAIDIRRQAAVTRAQELERKRLSLTSKATALLTGRGLADDLENEILIAIAGQEVAALDRLLAFVNGQIDQRTDLKTRAERALNDAWNSYRVYRVEHDRFEKLKRTSLSPAIWTQEGRDLRDRRDRLLRAYQDDYTRYRDLHRRAEQARKLAGYVVKPMQEVAGSALASLRRHIAEWDRARAGIQAFFDECKRVLFQALLIVVGVTLTPALIRAFWYWLVAPFISSRPAVRIDGVTSPPSSRPAAVRIGGRISGVSQEIVLGPGEELIVHPEFLQSSAEGGRKRTRWLLNWRFPLSSLASRMVALTWIREADGKSFVISSTMSPLSEVGIIALEAGRRFVLQPRYLIGLVQRAAHPIVIHSHWRFTASAWITLQFRYLSFEGPGALLVQGCRGIRLEPADGRRAIDQKATIGFDANLAYASRRAETFTPYLFGMRGLFNDSFEGPGVYAYEEMPYAGRRAGITGRGLEGLTDGVMKVFGI
jgi:hypothetical protein